MSLLNYARINDLTKFEEVLQESDIIPIFIPRILVDNKKYEYLRLVILRLSTSQIESLLAYIVKDPYNEELLDLFDHNLVFTASINYGNYEYISKYDPERIVAHICHYKIMNKNAILYAAYHNPINVRSLLEHCIEFQEELSTHISFMIEVINAMKFSNFYKHYEYCKIFANNNDINLPDFENITYFGLITYKSGNNLYAIQDNKLAICGKNVKLIDIDSTYEPSLFLHLVSIIVIYLKLSFPSMMIYIAIYITLIIIFDRSYIFNYKKFRFVNVGDKSKYYNALDNI